MSRRKVAKKEPMRQGQEKERKEIIMKNEKGRRETRGKKGLTKPRVRGYLQISEKKEMPLLL